MGYLISIIIFQTLFTLMLLLVTYKRIHVFEKLLSLFLFLMSIHFSVKLLFLLRFSEQSAFYALPSSFSLVYGPALFLLTSATYKTPKLKTVFLHFLPFLVMSGFYLFIIVQLHAFPLKNILVLPFYNKLAIMDLLSPIIYPVLSLYNLKVHKNEIDLLKFRLIKGLNYLVFGLPLCSLLLIALKPFGVYVDGRVLYVFMLFMVICIAIYKFRVKEFKTDMETQEVKEKYNTSTLSSSDLDVYQTKLQIYFSEKKPYLEPELTLQSLSMRCGIPKHHLTQLLNTRFNKNFYQFVNEFRVNEVVKYIPKQTNESLVDIAYQCGFNSKSTFNSYFKKITGLTPSEFKKQELLNT